MAAKAEVKNNRASAHVAAVKEGDMEVGYAGASAGVDKGFIPQVSADAGVSAMHLESDKKGLETAKIDVGQAKARAWAGAAGAGVEASANLVDLKASVFDLKIGLAADSKIGIKDDSATVGVGGTSITLGRKIGISFGGTGFGIDFGRIFK